MGITSKRVVVTVPLAAVLAAAMNFLSTPPAAAAPSTGVPQIRSCPAGWYYSAQSVANRVYGKGSYASAYNYNAYQAILGVSISNSTTMSWAFTASVTVDANALLAGTQAAAGVQIG